MTDEATKSSSKFSRWERILTIGLIVLGLLLIGFFGFRAARSFLRIQLTGLEPGVTNVELIRGWMTVPYIAEAYGVPEDYLFEQLDIPQTDNQDKSLRRLNFDYFNGEPEAILKVIKTAIRRYQAEHPPTPGADLMTDFSLTDFFLTAMINFGAPALGLALLLGALGLPLPGTLFVIAAGAFARQGIIHWADSSGLALLGAVLGDSASYAIGRFARSWVQHRFGQSAVWQRAQETFNRQGGMAIFLTRFLLTPLAIPTNLIAGGSGFSFFRFLFYDISGELTWILLYGGLGYLFGSQWEAVSQFISDFSGLLVGVVIFGAGVYIWLRRRRKPVDQPQAVKPL